MILGDQVDFWSDLYIIINRYPAQIKKRAGVVDENILPQPDVLSEIGIEWNEHRSTFINWHSNNVTQSITHFIHRGCGIKSRR